MLLAYRNIDTVMEAIPKIFEIESTNRNLLNSCFLISRLLDVCETQDLKRIATAMSEAPNQHKEKLLQIITELFQICPLLRWKSLSFGSVAHLPLNNILTR